MRLKFVSFGVFLPPLSYSPGVVSWLGAVRDDNRLNVTNETVRSGLRGTEEAEVIDAVKGEESGHRSLVNLSSDREERRLGRVGGTIGLSRGDLSLNSWGEEEGEEAEHVGIIQERECGDEG